MQPDADIARRLQRAALRRRAPLWLAVLLPWVLLLSPVGVALAVGWIGWDYDHLRARVRSRWTAWLDQSLPWLEDSSALLLRADGAIARMQRARILERLQADLGDDVVASIIRERVRFDWRVAAASALPALALLAWWQLSGAPVTARDVLARLAPQTSDLLVRVTPPRYTGAARSESPPKDLAVPQFSVIEWCRRTGQDTRGRVVLSDGRSLAISPGCVRVRALAPLSWRWRGRRYQLAVRPDQAPEATVSVPAELAEDAQTAVIAVRVRDDFQIRRASLHLTLARPLDGELSISEREVPIPESRDARSRSWSRQWSLAELGLQPGDELYVQVRALDNAETAQTGVSPTVVLRLPPPGDDSSLVLQRRVVAGIERLRAELALEALDEDTRLLRLEELAGAQDLLRERYAVYLDEDGELAPIDAAARPLVRRAAGQMLAAADALRAGDTQAALGAAQRALAGVAELRQAERMHLYPRPEAPLEERVTAGGAASTLHLQNQGSVLIPSLRTPVRIDTAFERAWQAGAP